MTLHMEEPFFCFFKGSMLSKGLNDRITKAHVLDLPPPPRNSGKWRFVGIPDPKDVKVVMIASFGGRSNPCILPRALPKANHFTSEFLSLKNSLAWRRISSNHFKRTMVWYLTSIAYSLLAKEAKTSDDSVKWNIFSHTHTQRKIYWLPFTAFSTWKFCSKLKSRFKDAFVFLYGCFFSESLLGGFGLVWNSVFECLEVILFIWGFLGSQPRRQDPATGAVHRLRRDTGSRELG